MELSLDKHPLAGARYFTMRTTRARITFKSNGGHNSAFIFSSGNGVTWLAAVAMSSSGVSVQKLGDVMFEKTSVDTITMTSNQWAQCVIIPISGTVDIASIQLSLGHIRLTNASKDISFATWNGTNTAQITITRSDGKKVNLFFTGNIVQTTVSQLSLGKMAIVGGTVSDMNGINRTGFYTGYNNPKGAPTDQAGAHWHIIHMQYASGWKAQIATSFGDGPVYKRVMFEGVWKPWLELQLSLDRHPTIGKGSVKSLHFQVYSEYGNNHLQAIVELPSGVKKTLNLASWKQLSLDPLLKKMDIISFNGSGRIGFQLTPKNGKRSCIIGVTNDNKLYIDFANENGEWLGARLLQLSLGKVDKRLRSGGNEPIRLDWREVAGGPKLCVYVSETEVVRFTPTFPKQGFLQTASS